MALLIGHQEWSNQLQHQDGLRAETGGREDEPAWEESGGRPEESERE